MTPSINLLNTHRAEKSPIQNRTAAATRQRAAPTAQVSGAKTLTLSSDSNAESGRERLISPPSGGASLDITEKRPAESFTPAKCRLHRFSGLHRFCSFFCRTPIQTFCKIYFHMKRWLRLSSPHPADGRLTYPEQSHSGLNGLGAKRTQSHTDKANAGPHRNESSHFAAPSSEFFA